MTPAGLLASFGIRPAEPDDLPPAPWWRHQCLDTRFVFTCTARRGHRGDHIAHGHNGRKLVRWN